VLVVLAVVAIVVRVFPPSLTFCHLRLYRRWCWKSAVVLEVGGGAGSRRSCRCRRDVEEGVGVLVVDVAGRLEVLK
jgi:hypothetical protein